MQEAFPSDRRMKAPLSPLRDARRARPLIRDSRTEKAIEAAGDRAMASLGFRVIRFSQSRATMQTPGIPDRRYVHAGRCLAIWWEAKREGGRPSAYQLYFQAECNTIGENYVRGTDDDLAAYVTRLLPCYPLTGASAPENPKI